MKAHVIKLGTTLLLACTALYGADPDAATLFRQAHTAYKQQNYPQALSLFRTMLEKYPDAKQAVRAWEYVAQCENALGNPMAAFEAYQKIWERHKDFSQLSVITRNQMKIGNYFLKNKQYKNAITVYEKILENAPHSDVAPGAQYSLAQAYLGEEDYSAARAELAKLIRNYPSSQLVDDAMFDLGYIAYVESKDAPYDQAATSEAIAAFRSFISNFPSSPKVPEAQQYIRLLRSRKAAALFRTAEFYENVRVPKAAQITYREVIEQYPDTPYADEARRRLEGAGRQTISEQLPPPRAAAVFSEDTETARTREASAVAAAPLAAPTPVTPITVRPATTAPGVPAHTPAADTLRNLSARRVAQLKNDPKGREVLRTTMKQAYMEELRRARATKAAWRAQQASRRSGSPSPAPQPLAPAQPASPTVASARAQTPPTRQPIAPPLTSATQPQDEDFAFEVRSQEAPIDVAAEPQAQAPQTHTSEQPATTAPRRSTPRMIVEYERSSPPPQPTTTTPSSSPTVPIEG
ncbi:MAG: outer membrane protein assembly factor BamD, partial [bacterium]|nr:outer membrane protein assembly factor BamD [bacterium]